MEEDAEMVEESKPKSVQFEQQATVAKPKAAVQLTGVDEYFGIEHQTAFLSNCHVSEDSEQHMSILAWNMVGIVSLRKEVNFTSIDVEFADKSMHQQFSLNDDFGTTMANLSYGGLLLASKGQKVDVDEYEEEVREDAAVDKRCSYLFYKSFKESRAVAF